MRISLITIVLLITNSVYADNVNEYIATECSSDSIELITGFINDAPAFDNPWPPKPYSIHYDHEFEDCKIDENTIINFYIEEGKYSASGMCGANPLQDLFIHLNGKPVLKQALSPKCGGILIKSITITAQTLTMCLYNELSYAAPWTNTPEPAYECSEMLLNQLRQRTPQAPPAA